MLSDTQSGVPGPAVIPQAFFRFGSTRLACCVARLEMRLTLVKTSGGGAAEARVGVPAWTRSWRCAGR